MTETDEGDGGGAPEWGRVKELLSECIERAPNERTAFLSDQCGDDLALRARVESLLRAHENAPDFFDDFAVDFDDEDDEPLPGVLRVVGPYRLGAVLGEGGMGIVYEAFQERPDRSVALKILRPSVVSRDSVQRFRYEVEILGRLQHPGIAQIFDAGLHREAAEGAEFAVPYFAMERVDGVALTRFAASLDVPRKLDLFLELCDAVHYAHQRGVIHRDLKPVNILVSAPDAGGTPRVKVLDFGVARVTDADVKLTVQATAVGVAVGTLPYMSPEQVLGNAGELDVRADVYALGVILYELLVGRLPVDVEGTSLAHGARRIAEEDPQPPSSFDAKLRGDLDTIVLHALEKDKDRRYGSVAELAADVRRFLHHEPIAARPPTVAYQLTKFARRQLGLVAGLAVAFALLVVAVVVISIGLEETKEEQRRTAAERDKATAVLGLLSGILTAASPNQGGVDVTVVTLLDQAVAGLASDHPPEVEATLRRAIGETYLQLHRVPEAVEQLDRACELFARELGETHERTLSTRVIAVRASARRMMGDFAARAETAAAQCRDVLGSAHPATWRAQEALGYALMRTARRDEAKDVLVAVLESQRAGLGPEHDDSLTTFSSLATVNDWLEREDEALAMRLEILEILQRRFGEDHAKTLAARQAVAVTLDKQGRHVEAEPYHRGLRQATARLYGEEHTQTFSIEEGLAQNLVRQQKLDEAEKLLLSGVEKARKLGRLPQRLNSLSVLYGAQGRHDEAEDHARRSYEATRAFRGDDGVATMIAYENWASALMKLRRFGEAEEVFATTLAHWRSVLPPGHADLVGSLNLAANCFATQQEWGKAEPLYREAEQIARDELHEGHILQVTAISSLGICLQSLRRFDEAEPLLVEASAAWSRQPAAYRARHVNVLRSLSATYRSTGRPELADEILRRIETPNQ